MRATQALGYEREYCRWDCSADEGREGLTVVTLPRTPRPLASLLQESVFNIARAGDPSPFATRRGRQNSS